MQRNARWNFGISELEAFNTLKLMLSSKPILRLYSPKAETELHSDASQSSWNYFPRTS